jgi:predicted nucleic acid-binding protein
MTRRIFVDSDVILDVLANRQPHVQAAKPLFAMIDRGEVKACTSPLIFSSLFYLLRKQHGPAAAKSMLRKLRRLFEVLPMDGKAVDGALDASMSDFEDALQYRCAADAGVDILITRNNRDFKGISIQHQTAEEFLHSAR